MNPHYSPKNSGRGEKGYLEQGDHRMWAGWYCGCSDMVAWL